MYCNRVPITFYYILLDNNYYIMLYYPVKCFMTFLINSRIFYFYVVSVCVNTSIMFDNEPRALLDTTAIIGPFGRFEVNNKISPNTAF